MKMIGWFIFEAALVAFFLLGYVLYRRARARDRDAGGRD